jgi:hypothetical protein
MSQEEASQGRGSGTATQSGRDVLTPGEPLDVRLYRSPDGELARLTLDRVAAPGGQRWWAVSLVRDEDDVQAVAGQPAIVWLRTREEARAVYRERLAALRANGWVRQR